MIYLRLVLAVAYWTLTPRKFLNSPLPLWIITWALIAGVFLAYDFPRQNKVLGATQTIQDPEIQKNYYEQEIARMRAAVVDGPLVRDAWLYLGWLEANFGSKEKALEVLQVIQTIDPNNPETLQLEKWLTKGEILP